MATEVLSMSAVSSPDSWALGAGASKVVAVASPDDDNTSYITSSTTLNTTEQFAVSNTSASILSNSPIVSVVVSSRCVKVTNNATYRVDVVVGGNTSTGTDHALGVGSSYQNFTDTFTTKPGGGSWTKSDIDSMEVKILNTTTNRECRCTTITATVTYGTLHSATLNASTGIALTTVNAVKRKPVSATIVSKAVVVSAAVVRPTVALIAKAVVTVDATRTVGPGTGSTSSLILRGSIDPTVKPPAGSRVNPNHPLARDLKIAWFNFDGAGGIVADSVGNFNGKILNDSKWGAGDNGYILNCPGNSASTNGVASNIFGFQNPGNSSYTLIARVRPSNTNTMGTVFLQDISYTESAPPSPSAFGILQRGGNWKIEGYGDSSIPNFTIAPVIAGKWVTVAVTSNGKGNILGYIDGIIRSSVNQVTQSLVPQSIHFGRFNKDFDAFVGKLDFCLVYSRALTPNEIYTISTQPYTPFQESLPHRVVSLSASTTHSASCSISSKAVVTIDATRTIGPGIGSTSSLILRGSSDPTVKPQLGTSLNQSHPLSQGLLLAVVPHNTTFLDSTGQYKFTPVSNQVSVVGGRSGPAIRFNGVVGSNLTNTSIVLPTTSCTVLVICKPSALNVSTQRMSLFGAPDTPNDNFRIQSHFPYEGVIYWDFGDVNVTGHRVSWAPTSSFWGNWHAVAFRAGKLGSSIWSDGIQKVVSAIPITRVNGSPGFSIGTWGTFYSTSDIEGFWLFNRELTNQEIITWAASPYGMFERALPHRIVSLSASTTHSASCSIVGRTVTTCSISANRVALSNSTGIAVVTNSTKVIKSGQSAIVGAAILTGSTRRIRTAQATLACTATVSCATQKNLVLQSPIVGKAVITCATSPIRSGAASLTCSASVSTSSRLIKVTTTSINGICTSQSTTAKLRQGTCGIVGVGIVSNTPRKVLSATTSIVGICSTVCNTTVAGGSTRSAMIGRGDVTINAGVITRASCGITGLVIVSDTAKLIKSTSGSFTGKGILTNLSLKLSYITSSINGVATTSITTRKISAISVIGTAKAVVSSSLQVNKVCNSSIVGKSTINCGTSPRKSASSAIVGKGVLSGSVLLTKTATCSEIGRALSSLTVNKNLSCSIGATGKAIVTTDANSTGGLVRSTIVGRALLNIITSNKTSCGSSLSGSSTVGCAPKRVVSGGTSLQGLCQVAPSVIRQRNAQSLISGVCQTVTNTNKKSYVSSACTTKGILTTSTTKKSFCGVPISGLAFTLPTTNKILRCASGGFGAALITPSARKSLYAAQFINCNSVFICDSNVESQHVSINIIGRGVLTGSILKIHSAYSALAVIGDCECLAILIEPNLDHISIYPVSLNISRTKDFGALNINRASTYILYRANR